MKARLQAEVQIWDIAAFAEVALWEKRPELQVLCIAARDGGSLDEGAIDAVLPGLSPRGRNNLLRNMHYIGLIGRNGAPSAMGHRCATTGEAPNWEQGAYHFLVATHALFGFQILAFKRTANDGFDRDFNSLAPIPPWLTPDRDRVFISALDGSRRFSVDAFPAARGQSAMCRSWEHEPGNLQWEIDLASGKNQWTIEAQVGSGDKLRSLLSVPDSVDPKDLVGLFASWEPRWDKRLGRVTMPYDGGIQTGGRESFLRTMEFGAMQVGRFGQFRDVLVQEVPVGPATDSDARKWATTITVARAEAADAFISPPAWHAEWSAAIQDTPLAGRAGDAPDVLKLREVNGRPLNGRMKWLLSAGADLGVGGP